MHRLRVEQLYGTNEISANERAPLLANNNNNNNNHNNDSDSINKDLPQSGDVIIDEDLYERDEDEDDYDEDFWRIAYAARFPVCSQLAKSTIVYFISPGKSNRFFKKTKSKF